MQQNPGALGSRLPIVVTALAIVLALIGVVGVAFGLADKPSNKVASNGSTTTTEFASETTLPGETTTTLAGAPGVTTATTVKGSTATTAKPGATTPTTSLDGTGDCPVPPASNSDPGAEQAPAVGTYTYVSCTDSSDTTDVKIAAGQNSNGVTRRDVSESAKGGPSETATEGYGPSGIYQEVLTINYGVASIKCDWNPDVLLFPKQLAVGKTWTADSSCTVPNPNAGQPGQPKSFTLHLTGDGKISGRVTDNVGGTMVNAWVLDAHIKLDTPNGSVNLTEHDHYDPVRGLNLFRYSQSSSEGQGSVTRYDHLKSLTPK